MKKLFKIAGGILGGLLILGIIANLTGNVEKPKEEPKQVAVVEPKEQEKPKAEPKVVVEKPKDESRVEKEYIDNTIAILTDTSSYMGTLTQLFLEPTIDNSVFFDKSWRQDIVVMYQKINEQRQKVVDMQAPTRFQKAHELTIKAFDSYMGSRDRVLQGIDTMNPNQIAEATNLINEGSEYFRQVQDEVQKIVAERN